LLRIATPPGVSDLKTLQDHLASGRPLTAMLMGAGWVPLTWWEPTVELLGERRFVEQSSMPPLSLWRHEREVRETAEGCEVVDRVSFAPRFPWPEPVVRGAVEQLFRHRHAQLRHRFGPGAR
jgi:ligand-binding SRPBCC domain-containing protein